MPPVIASAPAEGAAAWCPTPCGEELLSGYLAALAARGAGNRSFVGAARAFLAPNTSPTNTTRTSARPVMARPAPPERQVLAGPFFVFRLQPRRGRRARRDRSTAHLPAGFRVGQPLTFKPSAGSAIVHRSDAVTVKLRCGGLPRLRYHLAGARLSLRRAAPTAFSPYPSASKALTHRAKIRLQLDPPRSL
jgi:hypothetical protein